MFSLICDQKLVAIAESLPEAIELAKMQSLIVRGISVVTSKGKSGCIVSIWSGPIDGKGRGVTKHASFICGHSWK